METSELIAQILTEHVGLEYEPGAFRTLARQLCEGPSVPKALISFGFDLQSSSPLIDALEAVIGIDDGAS